DVSDAQSELFASLEKLAGSHAAFSLPDLPEETPTTDALLAERRNAFRIKAQLESMLEHERASRWSVRFRRSRYSAPVRRVYRGGRRLLTRLGTAREFRSATARAR